MTADPPAPKTTDLAPERRQRAVIDTNVWLDIHFFFDPEAKPLVAAFESPHWVAVRCRETDAELESVLQRQQFSSSPAERARLREHLRNWQASATLTALHGQAPCRCRDPHDQKFLDLAFAAQAAVLLTKDKALLALNRKSRRFGLTILAPRQFGGRFAQHGAPQRERIVQRVVAP